MSDPSAAYAKEVWGRARDGASACLRVGSRHPARSKAKPTSPASVARPRRIMAGRPPRPDEASLVASLLGMSPQDPSRLVFGAAQVITEEELAERVARSRPLRVKLGLDPTAPHVTLGWAVPLRKLRQFQDAGHQAVLIVGDFTARVGDPPGKSESKPRRNAAVGRANSERVPGRFCRVPAQSRLEVRYNSEWLESMSMEDVLRMTASYTVARMLERGDFAKRFAEQRPLSGMEFM